MQVQTKILNESIFDRMLRIHDPSAAGYNVADDICGKGATLPQNAVMILGGIIRLDKKAGTIAIRLVGCFHKDKLPSETIDFVDNDYNKSFDHRLLSTLPDAAKGYKKEAVDEFVNFEGYEVIKSRVHQTVSIWLPETTLVEIVVIHDFYEKSSDDIAAYYGSCNILPVSIVDPPVWIPRKLSVTSDEKDRVMDYLNSWDGNTKIFTEEEEIHLKKLLPGIANAEFALQIATQVIHTNLSQEKNAAWVEKVAYTNMNKQANFAWQDSAGEWQVSNKPSQWVLTNAVDEKGVSIKDTVDIHFYSNYGE